VRCTASPLPQSRLNVDPVIQRIRVDWYDRNFKDGGLRGEAFVVIAGFKSDRRHVTCHFGWCGCAATPPRPAVSWEDRDCFGLRVRESK